MPKQKKVRIILPPSEADPIPDPPNPLPTVKEAVHGDITEGEEGGGTSGLGNKERRRGGLRAQ